MKYLNNIIASIILTVIDIIWIKIYMKKKYEKLVKKIQKNNMKSNIFSAIAAYILMLVGLNLFVLPKIEDGNEFKTSILYGFSFGIIVYGVYDFTNGVIFKDWDFKLAFIDILWGGFVYFLSSFLPHIISKQIKKNI
mgnify:CR=1 FL=1